MNDHVYKHIMVTGSSPDSIDAAIRNAVHTAGKTVHGMRWFEMRDVRGHIDGNDVRHWQVTVEIGFTLDG